MQNHGLVLLLAGLAAGCAVDDLAIGELEQAVLVLESDKIEGPKFSPYYGFAVALEADRLVVGAPALKYEHKGGEVLIYRKRGDWQLAQTLTAGEATIHESWGKEFALDGDRLAVAAIGEKGWFVSIFERIDEHWIETAKIRALDVYYYGAPTVALEGNRLVVGWSADDAVFSYLRQTNGSWLKTQTVQSPTPGAYGFGWKVALSSGRLLVANLRERAFIFRLNASGIWTPEATLVHGSDEEFAYSIDLDGDVAIIGNWRTHIHDARTRIYKRINGAWNNIQNLDLLATSIDVDGTGFAVANPYADCGPATGSGCAYLYHAATPDRSSWGAPDVLLGSDIESSYDPYGSAVSLSGTAVAVGAMNNGAPPGAVYLFDP